MLKRGDCLSSLWDQKSSQVGSCWKEQKKKNTIEKIEREIAEKVNDESASGKSR